MNQILHLDVESFKKTHRHLNPALLVEHARVALARHHATGTAEFAIVGVAARRAILKFRAPDPRSTRTLQEKEFTEKGAIVIAGLLLVALEKKVITMVTEIGDRCDYFVGEEPGDLRWILEVSGTDHGVTEGRRDLKRNQLLKSRFAAYPFVKGGFVAVTRFAPPAESCLDAVRPVRRKRG